MSWHEVRLPAVDPDTVIAFASGLADELRSTRRRQLRLSVLADRTRIRFALDGAHSADLNRLQAAVPGVRLMHHDEVAPSVRATHVAELSLTTTHRPVAADRIEQVSAAVLGTLDQLHADEGIELRFILRGTSSPPPARRIPQAQAARPMVERFVLPHPSTWHVDPDAARAERDKQAYPLLLVSHQIGVRASEARAITLNRALTSALGSLSQPGVGLRPRRTTNRRALRRFLAGRPAPFMLLNAAELAATLAWPVGDIQLSRLDQSVARLLPTAASASGPGTQLGVSAAQPSKRIKVRDAGRFEHVHVIGPTGTGKSTLIAQMALQDISRGWGTIVIDPKGDLVTDLLARAPAHCHGDILVLDPSADRLLGLNPLALRGQPDLVVDHLLSTLHSLFRSSWGPRTADVLRSALLTLVIARQPDEDQAATLLEVPALLTNAGFRRQLLAEVDDPVGLDPFWRWFEQLSDAERATVIGPTLNKLRALLLRPALRTTLGQAQPRWSLDDVFERGRTLLVSLPAGTVGQEATELLGSILVSMIWQGAQARARFPIERRRPVAVYLDEFQQFVRLPIALSDMLAQARSLRVGFTLAHQHLGQLSSETSADVLSVRSRVVFQTVHRDAAVLVRDMPPLDTSDLLGLERFEAYAQLSSGAHVTRPVSLATEPVGPVVTNPDEIRRASEERWGRTAAEVTSELSDRLQTTSGSEDEAWLLGEGPIEGAS